MTSDNILSEVALRCGDPEFKDFEKQIYQRASYRSNREIAKFYGILRKTLSFTLSEMTSDLDGDIILDLPDLKSEYLVSINGQQLVKVANQIEPAFRWVYYLEFKEGTWYFNYTLGMEAPISGINISGQDITETMSQSLFERIDAGVEGLSTLKSMDDEIVICYTIIPDMDSELGEFDIPSKLEEEQIDRAVHYMAKLGMVKYPVETSEKGQKYYRLLQLYRSEKKSDYDPRLVDDAEFIKIKPWSVV